MKKTIEFDEKCKACDGTGLYVGFAENDGVAVVCYKCNGTGCFHFKYEYEPFEKRVEKKDVIWVIQSNPGIGVGSGKHKEFNLADFGGMSIKDWEDDKKFVHGMEMRKFVCPAWWYQTANYELKPSWDWCSSCGAFSNCSHFSSKETCWERWDKEFGEK